MKNIFYLLALIIGIIVSCNSSKTIVSKEKNAGSVNDTVRIANDSLEYEVIIIDPGFNTWLASRAYPRWYYTQEYLETKNQIYVNEWNNRVLQPQRYNPNLYEMTINYDPNIDYGYEVNYLIYNYMVYFQNNYHQRLFGRVPLR
ncbi:DUF6146 family protein [Flavobacterium sp. ARAG 55.4]|uniref:DUF6146 family protein n=1 Tax=Flavobacterium plantiphilum TaxID=3163297 RepID=A0ABW8XWU6_9FLAO